MNNQAILLSVLGLFTYTVRCFNWAISVFRYDKWSSWLEHNYTKDACMMWSAEASFLLLHALFTLSYLRTTLKLHPLIEITKVYCEMLEKIPEREMKLEPLTTPKELEET